MQDLNVYRAHVAVGQIALGIRGRVGVGGGDHNVLIGDTQRLGDLLADAFVVAAVDQVDGHEQQGLVVGAGDGHTGNVDVVINGGVEPLVGLAVARQGQTQGGGGDVHPAEAHLEGGRFFFRTAAGAKGRSQDKCQNQGKEFLHHVTFLSVAKKGIVSEKLFVALSAVDDPVFFHVGG